MPPEENAQHTPTPKPSLWSRLRRWIVKKRFTIEIVLALFALLLLFFWDSIFITIRSGELGVMYRRFMGGTVMERTYNEGLHIVPPWDKLYVYDIRVQRKQTTFSVLTVDGLNIEVEVIIRYHPVFETLPSLHRFVGPDYVEKVVLPEIQSVLRIILGQLHLGEIYTTDRDILRIAALEAMLQVSEKYIQLDDLLITRITLPEMLRNAIERKLMRQQLALEYEYRLLESEQEAKRKKIEAQGIRDFQDIVSEGISEYLLRWRGIEATLELAKSNNAKVVIIGGSDGLPLILNTGDFAASDMTEPATGAIGRSVEELYRLQTNFDASMALPGEQQ